MLHVMVFFAHPYSAFIVALEHPVAAPVFALFVMSLMVCVPLPATVNDTTAHPPPAEMVPLATTLMLDTESGFPHAVLLSNDQCTSPVPVKPGSTVLS